MLSPPQVDDAATDSSKIPDREDQIAADKIRLVFQHAPLAIAVNPTVGLLVVIRD